MLKSPDTSNRRKFLSFLDLKRQERTEMEGIPDVSLLLLSNQIVLPIGSTQLNIKGREATIVIHKGQLL